MKAAIDSSVLIAVNKLGYLTLVTKMFDKLVIVQSVIDEISNDEAYVEVRKLIDSELVDVIKGSRVELLGLLSYSLGKGEAETIAVACELGLDFVLLDDLRARKVARRLKLNVMGTLAVLKVLLDLDLIDATPEDLCKKLIRQHFWVDTNLCLKVLKGQN